MNLSIPQPATTKPELPGIYLTKRRNKLSAEFWRAFDGTNWHYGLVRFAGGGAPSYQEAMLNGAMRRGTLMDFDWQGLADKPE